MDLKTFVAQSLSEISEGIIIAQEKNPRAIINPNFEQRGGNGNSRVQKTGSIENVNTTVMFDVAITVENKGSVTGEGKLEVIVGNLGVDGAYENKNQSMSRIQFEIPVIFPRPDSLR